MNLGSYHSVRQFFTRYYSIEPDDHLATANALTEMRDRFHERLAVATEMLELLNDGPFASMLPSFLQTTAHRQYETEESARAFVEAIFRANLFDVVLDIESGAD
jgi:hypothetical protein